MTTLAWRSRFGPHKPREIGSWLCAVRVAGHALPLEVADLDALASALGADPAVRAEVAGFSPSGVSLLDVLPIGSGRAGSRLFVFDVAWVTRTMSDSGARERRLGEIGDVLGLERAWIRSIEALVAQEQALAHLREDLFWNLD